MTDNQQLANALRLLAADAVEAAKSGHPGMPLGMAEIALALWQRHLRHNPANPDWANRDRFVLSNGHGSMLLYALLHLSGYDLKLEELRNFRQLHSKTPGHPEYKITPGVETTTGPLGQGLANAVGMALAEKLLAAEFNRPDYPVVDHHTYAFIGDGCLMEGVSHEACALAGVWRLGKLICFYDDNGISIDGEVQPWFADDTPARFRAYGWQVVEAIDGHDVEALSAAIDKARANEQQPTLLCCRSVIGKGAPTRAGTGKAHGEPLGAEELAGLRAGLGWQHPPFVIPQDIYQAWDARARGAGQEQQWQQLFESYASKHPELARELQRRWAWQLPANFEEICQQARAQMRSQQARVATRKASQQALEVFTAALPELLGGSADLTGSNLTQTSHTAPLRFDDQGAPNQGGRHINYGVREFGMSAIANGLVLHGGYRPYVGTFLTFSDYARNALRMAALMRVPTIFVYTHDSIGLGEDGPTHQAVEHISSLRLMPNLELWRPADSEESLVAWRCALQRLEGPTALALSRQALPYLQKAEDAEIARGAYIISEALAAAPELVIIATGSEVSVALAAQQQLADEQIYARVVSMPSVEAFERQDQAYRARVLPAGCPRVAIEAGVSDYWHKFQCQAILGIDSYGESAPAAELYRHFQLTAEQLATASRALLARDS